MAGSRRSARTAKRLDIDSAIAALSGEDLRELVREILPLVDAKTRRRIRDRIVGCVAHGDSGWAPAGPPAEFVETILDFALAAARVGYADPREVDEYLREGMHAFLSKDYVSARDVFRALLPPIGEAEIDLGYDELVEEVLSVDLAACASMYAAATYMCTEPVQRAEAVLKAVDEVSSFGYFLAPIAEMERVATEPLPALDGFLPQWRALLERSVGDGRDGWEGDRVRWLHEAVERTEGANGLATRARSTGRSEDLYAWCRALMAAANWKETLAACNEAAGIVNDDDYAAGWFLDGAALAAQALGRRDVPSRLQRAWRAAPSLLRLRRWLGFAKTKPAMRNRAAQAIELCPSRCARQLVLLHLVLGDVDSAARLLAKAPGLGWSAEDHPGHMLFPIFMGVLGRGRKRLAYEAGPTSWHQWDEDDDEDQDRDDFGLEHAGTQRSGPLLAAPEVDEILEAAGFSNSLDDASRSAALRAMRKAAEKRVAGVTGKQRRRHYNHAACLVAACAALDTTPGTAKWVAGIRENYRRYPAFRSALADRVGP